MRNGFLEPFVQVESVLTYFYVRCVLSPFKQLYKFHYPRFLSAEWLSRAVCSGRKCPHLLLCRLRYFRLSNNSINSIIRDFWVLNGFLEPFVQVDIKKLVVVCGQRVFCCLFGDICLGIYKKPRRICVLRGKLKLFQVILFFPLF